MLFLKNVSAGYGETIILKEVSLKVDEGEVTAVIGPNGAGKSTLLKTIAGLLRPKQGEIYFMQKRIDRMPPHEIVKLGITLIPEGRRLFPAMTVLENLLMGAYMVTEKDELKRRLEWVYGLFPVLRERSRQLAGTLSGGEQQMLAIARGLMLMPKLLMLDEPSTGLAPKLVSCIFNTLKELKKQGVSILLVEQNVYAALRLASRAYVLEEGKIIMDGPSEKIIENDRIRRVYLHLG